MQAFFKISYQFKNTVLEKALGHNLCYKNQNLVMSMWKALGYINTAIIQKKIWHFFTFWHSNFLVSPHQKLIGTRLISPKVVSLPETKKCR